eukprot:TRINITY_DN5216_c0_g1_i3.p1 TRINITY_DN5216_c0_g1~~TRINITY_DN5216_c0_g1_i3.p1  ORF type:complete len:216 (-),score=48.70 TRINITY_DN5216_c0_g1_i3:125-772(-)
MTTGTVSQYLDTKENAEYDFLFKIVLVGDSGVGKSCLLLRFADDSFNENYLATIGVDFRFKTIEIDQSTVKLQMWDTAGQEKFRCITNAYYKGADAVVIVFDTNNRTSFENVSLWLDQVQEFASEEVEVILAGNKCDLQYTREVNVDEILEYSKANRLTYHEVSAKMNIKVFELFVSLSKRLIEKKLARSPRKGAITQLKGNTLQTPTPTKENCC